MFLKSLCKAKLCKAKDFAGRVGATYARMSNRKPYLVAAMTATSILTCSDLSCQLLEALYINNAPAFEENQHKGWRGCLHKWDWRRTLALGAFGFLYYGGPCKALYMAYDRMFSTAVR